MTNIGENSVERNDVKEMEASKTFDACSLWYLNRKSLVIIIKDQERNNLSESCWVLKILMKLMNGSN